MESPGDRTAAIKSVLESIALIPEELDRQVYVQHLHQQTQKYRKGSDRELFQLLDKIIAEQKKRNRYKERSESAPPAPVPHPVGEEPPIQQNEPERQPSSKKKPHYEKEIIRLMLQYGERMIKFIGHNIADDHFEDEELREFYKDIIKRHLEDEEVSVQHYTNREEPYSFLVGDIMLEQYSVSEKHAQRTGSEVKRDRNPFKTAKYAMKYFLHEFFKRKHKELSDRISKVASNEKEDLVKKQRKISSELKKYERIGVPADKLFEDPDFLKNDSSASISGRFEYKMKGEK